MDLCSAEIFSAEQQSTVIFYLSRTLMYLLKVTNRRFSKVRNYTFDERSRQLFISGGFFALNAFIITYIINDLEKTSISN